MVEKPAKLISAVRDFRLKPERNEPAAGGNVPTLGNQSLAGGLRVFGSRHAGKFGRPRTANAPGLNAQNARRPKAAPITVDEVRPGTGTEQALDEQTSVARGSETERALAATVRAGGLPAQAEALHEVVVTGEVVALEVVQKLATTARQGEKTATGVEILAVDPKVVGEVVDARGKQRDLNLARAGVLLVGLVLRDDVLLVDDF